MNDRRLASSIRDHQWPTYNLLNHPNFCCPKQTRKVRAPSEDGDAVFKDPAGDSASNVGRIVSTVGSGRQIQAVGTNEKPSSSRVSILYLGCQSPTNRTFVCNFQELLTLLIGQITTQ
jgi:hypothetical protein